MKVIGKEGKCSSQCSFELKRSVRRNALEKFFVRYVGKRKESAVYVYEIYKSKTMRGKIVAQHYSMVKRNGLI
jgi:hypothetical protein